MVSEPAASEQEAESLGDGLADDPMAQGARDILEEVSALLAAKGPGRTAQEMAFKWRETIPG
ncbi:MAG: hypothetical protein ABJC74_10830 [Gemmatimonadota bacterium]